MVGHLGATPSISPIRTARIAVFLVPGHVVSFKMVEPRGIAPRSTQCHCVVLLLDDGPEMERAPGLAPGKSGFASRRLDDFGIARVLKWEGRRVLPPLGDLHRIECWLLHHGLHLKVIRLRVPPPSGLAYKASA